MAQNLSSAAVVIGALRVKVNLGHHYFNEHLNMEIKFSINIDMSRLSHLHFSSFEPNESARKRCS